MNKCEVCGNECAGKTCSGKCRAKLSRRTVKAHDLGAQARRTHQSARATKEPDFDGRPTVEQVSQLADSPCLLSEELLDQLPPGVPVPTSQPDADTADLTGKQLHSKVGSYNGVEWKHSPEYAELIYRLLTWTMEELKNNGQTIPQWKAVA